MGAMQAFLEHIDTPQVKAFYEGIDAAWNERAARLNALFTEEGLPLRVANLGSIWTVCYTQPSRYNWMLQYYLRAEGLALSWVGSGRIVFSLNYSDADFDAVAERFVAAARKMEHDGWWWCAPDATNKSIRRGILREVLAQRLRGLLVH